MKQAIGDANFTVITIILIGAILHVFYIFVPRILNSMQDKSCCTHNNGIVEKGNCVIYQTINKNEQLTYSLSNFRNYCK